MTQLALHHINVIVTDLPRSLAFYNGWNSAAPMRLDGRTG